MDPCTFAHAAERLARLFRLLDQEKQPTAVAYNPQPKAPQPGHPQTPGGPAADLDADLCLQWREITQEVSADINTPPPISDGPTIATWLKTHADSITTLDYAGDIYDTITTHAATINRHLGLDTPTTRRYTTSHAARLLQQLGITTTPAAIRALGRRGAISVHTDHNHRRTYDMAELLKHYKRPPNLT